MLRHLALLTLICLAGLAQTPEDKKAPSKLELAQSQYYYTIKTYIETYASTPGVTCIELAEASLSASSGALENYRRLMNDAFTLPVDKTEEIRRSIEETSRRWAIQAAVEARFKNFKEEQSRTTSASKPPTIKGKR